MLGAIGVTSPMGVAGAALECTTDIETEWPSVFNPVVSDDGTRIAFESFGDLTGDNPDGNLEVFVHDTTEPSLVQVSDGPGHKAGSTFNPAISGDGSYSPTNPGERRRAQTSTATRRSSFTRSPPGRRARSPRRPAPRATGPRTWTVTAMSSCTPMPSTAGRGHAPGGGRRPPSWSASPPCEGSVSADGDIVAFTTFDSTYGANPDGQGEVVVYNVVADSHDTDHGDAETGGAFPVGSGSPTRRPGDTLTFFSGGNPNGLNPTGGFQVYVHELSTNTTEKLTAGPGWSTTTRRR